ncbi:MAG: carboxypeptidase regulatory-like domain-containing protein [Planctomycetales bacterium]|nr:carboxypeptidase regulatory-like domain-containing protein [Planctomycetales bacterium]
MKNSSASFWILLPLAVMLAGCGESDQKIPISGIVFCDGKPFEGASVAFIGNNGGSFSSATTDNEGKFSMRAAPGQNKVAVSKANTENVKPMDPNEDQTMPTEAEYAIMVKSAPKPLVAERFADPDKSGITIEVKEGMDSVDINVTTK